MLRPSSRIYPQPWIALFIITFATSHLSSLQVKAFTNTNTNTNSILSNPTTSLPSSRRKSFTSNHPHPPHNGQYSGSSSKLNLDGEGMANGTFNKHIVGDILRSLQPRYLSQVKQSIQKNIQGARKLDLEPFHTYMSTLSSSPPPIPTWEDLSKRLYQQQTPSERSFRERLSKGDVHSALANIRRFDNNNDNNIQITFYKDSASWCPYCQKVWMALEEKQIPYEVIRVDMNCYAGGSKPSEFLSIQPSGNLPCAVIHNDENQRKMVIGESDAILDLLDELSPSNPKKDIPQLKPEEGTEEAEYFKYLCNDGRNSLERRLFAEWMWYLTGKRKPREYRQRYEAMLDEVELALTPDPTAELAAQREGPFFMGKQVSLVDIKFIPFMERQAASLSYFKGFQLRDESRWPNLVKWFEAMEARPSYLPTKSDYYTHSRSLPPQLSGGCSFYDGCEAMRDSIDAYSQTTPTSTTSSSSSDLKNDVLFSWREPGWNTDEKVAKREAAERIISNHKKIIQFASRAAGTPGFPAASAPLADPKAVSNEDAASTVDVFLRYVVYTLLVSEKELQKQNQQRQQQQQSFVLENAAQELAKGGFDTVQSVVDCLDYLRIRIGVPRDMSYPAARELKQKLLHVTTTLFNSSTVVESNNEKATIISK